MILATDPNNWSYGYAHTFVPHARRGFKFYGDRIDDTQINFTPARVPTPKNFGAEGGNVGRLDGSVVWKPVREMHSYRGSGLWEDNGCFAMW